MTLINRLIRDRSCSNPSEKEDPRLIYLKACTLTRQGREAEAQSLLKSLADQEVSPSLKRSVQEDLEVFQGGGPWAKRFELGWRRFLRGATDPAVIGGMAAGQIVFAPLRAMLLRSMWNPALGRYLYGSLVSRFAAAGVATAVEVPVFWGVSKKIEQGIHRCSEVGGVQQALHEIGNLGMMIGVLRVAGFGATSILQTSAGISAKSSMAPLASWLQRHPVMVHNAASVGGLYGLHWYQGGQESNRGKFSRLIDALVGTLQFGLTGSLVNRLLGSGYGRFQSELERGLEIQENIPPKFLNIFSQIYPHFAWEGVSPKGSNIFKAQSYEGGGSTQSNSTGFSFGVGRPGVHPAQAFILEVLEKGNSTELTQLKEILLATYEHLGFKLVERTARHFQYKDLESWKSGIRIISQGGQESPLKLAEALLGSSEFQEMVQQWQERPHFGSAAEIGIQNLGYRYQPAPMVKRYLDELREALHSNPHFQGFKIFLGRGQGLLKQSKSTQDDIHEWEHAQAPLGKTLSVGRVAKLGLILEFNEKGFFANPIKLIAVPDVSWVKSTLDAFGRGEAWELPPRPEAPPRPKDKRKRTVPDIPVEFFPDTKRSHFFLQVERIAKRKLGKHGEGEVVAKIREHYRNASHGAAPELVKLPGGGKAHIFTVMYGGIQHGIVFRFDRQGKLITPFHMGSNFTEERIEKIKASLKKGEVDLAPLDPPIQAEASPSTPIPPAYEPLPEQFFRPTKEEDPNGFALRFLNAGQDVSEERQLQMAKGLEDLIMSIRTRNFALETVNRFLAMTQHFKEDGQVVARRYALEGLREPLTLYNPPATVLPKPWTQFFAQQLRTELQKGPKVDLMVELGSDNGWLSLYIKKLGLVKEVTAIDPRETARSVARINAALNKIEGVQIKNTRMRSNTMWDDLPIPRRADLMVAAISAKGSPLKLNHWALLTQAVANGRIYLNSGGRIFLGIEDPQDYPFVADLLKQYSFQTSAHLQTPEPGNSNSDMFIMEARLGK